jgi:hypothetical protein
MDFKPDQLQKWVALRSMLDTSDSSRISKFCRQQHMPSHHLAINQENIDPQVTEQSFSNLHTKSQAVLDIGKPPQPAFGKVTSELFSSLKTNHTHLDILLKMNK